MAMLLISLFLAIFLAQGCEQQSSAFVTESMPYPATSEQAQGESSQSADPIKHRTTAQNKDLTMQQAMFGAGCFWGVETRFSKVEGVLSTAVGYSGGNISDPTYKDVCTGTTYHAEVIKIEFNPNVVTYEQLLHLFWSSHDPTQLNRQGPDFGTQYRTVVFYYSPEQKESAESLKARLQNSGLFKKKIVTDIKPAKTFWRAEEYHQQYLAKRGLDSCSF